MPSPQDGADPEGRAPADIVRQNARLQKHDRPERAERRADPEAAVDREVDPPAKAAPARIPGSPN